MPCFTRQSLSPSHGNENTEEEEEDYLSMTITEPTIPKQKETYAQRRIRLVRESEAKSRALPSTPLPKATDLSTSIPTGSKGFQMLSKLGYKPGSTLGKVGNPNARTEPLSLIMKDDRGGVGLSSEKKRKFREEVEGVEAKEREEAEGFRERVAKEKEERRLEAMVRGAMAVLEGLEAIGSDEDDSCTEKSGKEIKGKDKRRVFTKQINVLWRGLVKERDAVERERRMRYNLHQSSLWNSAYDNPQEDGNDRLALGKEEEEIDEGDSELEEFNALEPAVKLTKLVGYLRKNYCYCFWCKSRYEDEGMEGCPGITEDDHD